MLDQNVTPGPHSPFMRAHAIPWKENGDIITLIEFLLEYYTAGDPITARSRRTTPKDGPGPE